MKKKFFAVALATTMVASSVVPAMADTVSADIESGLIGYYTFDDTLKNNVGEGSAKLHGGAGDTWNADATGTPTYAEGKNGKAYSFTGDVNGKKGEGLELDVKMPAEYTISYWVNPDTVNSATSMVFVPIDLDNGLNIADNWFGKTFPTVRIWGASAATADSYIDNWQEEADSLCNVWTYITLTGNSEGKTVLYINGKSVGEGSSIAGAFKDMYMYLGINFWDPSFDGMMDDVAVYNRALSADDVAALYEKNGVPVKEDEPSTDEDPTEPSTDEKPTKPANPSPEPTEPANPSPKPEEPTTGSSVTDVIDFGVTDEEVKAMKPELGNAEAAGLPANTEVRVATIGKAHLNYKEVVDFLGTTLKGKKAIAVDLSLMLPDGAAVDKKPNGNVKVTLPVSGDIAKATWIQVYRYEGKDGFKPLGQPVQVNKDGKFTFETDHFTPYVFESVDAPNPDTTKEPTTTGKTVTDTNKKPNTGDSAPIAVFAGMAAAGLAVFAVSKKRKNA